VYRDALGEPHHLCEGEPRIASLVPSITELLFALGLGDHVAARTSFCVHPSDQVAAVPTIGGPKKINHAKLRALQPTHAILNIDENPKSMAAELAEYCGSVIVTHPIEPYDNMALFRLLGGIFNRMDTADALAESFTDAFKALRARTGGLPSKRVLYLIWKDPWMTISRDTYIARMLNLIHWQHALHDPAVRYPKIELQPALLETIDLVLFSSEPYAFREEHLDAFAGEYGISRHKLRLVDGECLSWYGSRALQGLQYLEALATRD